MIGQTAPKLYAKLRPFLRVYVLNHASHGVKVCAAEQANRQPLSINCTRNYLWGHYYGGLEWNPHEPTEKSTRLGYLNDHDIGTIRPTYEQFCTWYKLPEVLLVDDYNMEARIK